MKICSALCCGMAASVCRNVALLSPQVTATHCNTLQHTTAFCNTLQHTATRCNILQHPEDLQCAMRCGMAVRACHARTRYAYRLCRRVMSHISMSHVTRLKMCVCEHCCHRNTLQHTATHCNYTATHCSTLQHMAAHCNTLQHTATHCNTLQHTATRCNTLKHTATHYNTRQCRVSQHGAVVTACNLCVCVRVCVCVSNVCMCV